MGRDPVGLMIIRAWLEGGAPAPLRVEIRLTTDVSAGFQRHLALSEVDGVRSVVGAWLAEILAGREPDGGTPSPG